MIELEAASDPEAVPPAPRPGRARRRAIAAGVTLLAVAGGGFAVTSGVDRPAEPLALMAGNAAAGVAAMTPADGAVPAAPAPVPESTAARSSLPYGWGVKFEVAGRLPALPDHASSWNANTPGLDRGDLARIAEALGVPGTPVRRDGGWFVEGGDWTLSAYGGSATGKDGAWHLNLYRNRSDGHRGDTTAGDTPAGPAISRSEADQRVRDLLARMGAPRASWKAEISDIDLGVGWACAAPGSSPEELRTMEADKVARLEGGTAASRPVAPCPPPPPPAKGLNVGLYPLVDGRRADWPVWNVTMRSDGRLENLHGSWVNFERGGDYKLRGIDAALKDLMSPPGVAYPTGSPAAAMEPATDLRPDGPVCPAPVPMPMPVEDAAATTSVAADCRAPAPQVVKITGAELGLIQTTVFEDGRVRLAVVPSYRFTGHFEDGQPWETSMLALHPSAIAPPPDFPVDDGIRAGSGGITGDAGAGVGKSIPPAPAPEAAVGPDGD